MSHITRSQYRNETAMFLWWQRSTVSSCREQKAWCRAVACNIMLRQWWTSVDLEWTLVICHIMHASFCSLVDKMLIFFAVVWVLRVVNKVFRVQHVASCSMHVLWCDNTDLRFHSPQPDPSWYCKTSDTGLVHCMICLFISQPKLFLIYQTKRDGRLSWPSLWCGTHKF